MDYRLYIISILFPTVISMLVIFMDRFIGLFAIERHSIRRIEKFFNQKEYIKIEKELKDKEKKKMSLMKNWGYDLTCITVALVIASFGLWYGEPKLFPIFNQYNTTDLVLLWLVIFTISLIVQGSTSLLKHYDGEITDREGFSLSKMLEWISINRYTLLCNGIGFTSLSATLGVLAILLVFKK